MSSRLSSLLTRLTEAVQHRQAFFLTKTEKTMGLSLDVSFKTMTHVYLGDLGARASIDLLADQIAVKFFFENFMAQQEGLGFVSKIKEKT